MSKKTKEFLARMKADPEKVVALIKKNPALLGEFLAEATKKELWEMADLFRPTDGWHDFLCALLSMPEGDWHGKRKLHPEYAKKYFGPEDIVEIVRIYNSMRSGGEPSPILFNLDYDRYWEYFVSRTIQLALDKIQDGLLPGSRIPTEASAKCLADLTNKLKGFLKEPGEE